MKAEKGRRLGLGCDDDRDRDRDRDGDQGCHLFATVDECSGAFHGFG